ncbi:MAG: DUF3084 domain-containing protein [Methylacidiphilales bacterium]|nr:DUF3084 domain-containing protein [Candidatus Methylacidiphilales bacterium]NJR15115.1 DUF3084 domain-containing protein [Calothrix sp. CSU_2_0]
MTTAYILITAILILGGFIATVGDRIGTRVGKKRLSLFKLRPKNTAVLVTILTGIGISASTLGILFLADSGLRDGVFKLENIRKDLRRKREQLKGAETQINQVTGELNQAKTQEAEAQKRLENTNKNLQDANKKQKETQTALNRTIDLQAKTQNQLRSTQSRLGQVVVQYQQAISQLQSVYDERKKLQEEIVQQKLESQRLFTVAKLAIDEAKSAIQKRDRELQKRKDAIESRDRKIAQLDDLIQKRNIEVTAREQIIAQRESRLKELETQQGYLEEEVTRLEQYYQSFRDLRLGKLALVRGQMIASAVVSVQQPAGARQVAIKLLEAANQTALSRLSEPGSNLPSNFKILQISNEQIQQLSKQISDGRQYVVRVFSAGNYVRGEKRIEFFTDASVNQIVFKAGEILATTNADSKTMTSYQLRQRLDLLISASQFRARNAGILDDIQIDSTFLRFLSQLQQYDQAVEIKAIAAENTFTAGPLKLKFIAIQNGQVLFGT